MTTNQDTNDSLATLPPLPDISFDHTGFITPDIHASVQFWQDILGFEAQPIGERRQEWIGGFMGVKDAQVRLVHLFGHGSHIEFIQIDTPYDDVAITRASQGNVAHICLMTSDVDSLRARILAGGGSEQGRMVFITEGIARGAVDSI